MFMLMKTDKNLYECLITSEIGEKLLVFFINFPAFVLNLSKSCNILFRSMAKRTCLFSSASIVIGRR